MPLVCDACPREAEPSYYVELEYPVAGAADEPAGRISGQLCGACARGVARSPAAGKLIAASEDAPDPSAGRGEHARAADGLCEVTLAIEGVDYNALRESDLAALMDAWSTIHEMTLQYRQDQRPSNN